MSNEDMFAQLGLKECKICADIKSEQWFLKAAQGQVQGNDSCLVCATEMGIDTTSRGTDKTADSNKHVACELIQRQIENRVSWLGYEHQETEHRESKKDGNDRGSHLSEVGRGGPRNSRIKKLKTKNQMLMSALETARWQEVHTDEEAEETAEKEAEPQKKRPRRGTDSLTWLNGKNNEETSEQQMMSRWAQPKAWRK